MSLILKLDPNADLFKELGNPPQSNLPQSNLPQSNLPQSNLPQSNLPQSNLPQSNLPQSNPPQSPLPDWWENLKKDSELAIQIRKDNSIDVYYNGGNIITGLKFVKNNYRAEINCEYIPLVGNKKYIPYSFKCSNCIDFNQNLIKPLSLTNFTKYDLDLIKKRIKKFYPDDSEKGIQHRFILGDPFFIDAEFQLNNGVKKMRADLVRVDINLEKIVFVEVKTMANPDIYTNGPSKPAKIVQQLDKYIYFIKNYKKDLLKYYKDIFCIKKALGLLPIGLSGLQDINTFDILDKPLLIFGGCEQEWINNNATSLDNKIRNIAKGCYYFGAINNCDIIGATKGNRHIF